MRRRRKEASSVPSSTENRMENGDPYWEVKDVTIVEASLICLFLNVYTAFFNFYLKHFYDYFKRFTAFFKHFIMSRRSLLPLICYITIIEKPQF